MVRAVLALLDGQRALQELAHALRVPEVAVGRAQVPQRRRQARVAREGTDATVVALSLMVHHTLAAAEKLAGEGQSIEVIDPRTVSPLDFDTILGSVAKTGRLLVVDEAFGPCGFASEIAARVADEGFDELDAPVRRLNGAHAPVPYSPTLEQAVVPGADTIEAAIRALLEE